MVVLVNRAKMTTSTTGTGTITLGSVVDGYQTFAAAGVSNGDSVRYVIEDGTSNWEIGSGTYTASGTTLSRTPSESSGGGSAINLSGDAIVFISAIASDIQPVTYVSTTFTATAAQTTFTVSYTVGLVEVFLNGAKLSAADFTATNGTSVVLASGANVGDTVDVVAYGTVSVSNTYTQAQANALFVDVAGDTMTGNLSFGDNDKAIFGAGSDLQIYHDGSHSRITDAGTGNLRLRGSNVGIESNAGHDIFTGVEGGAVTIYHNNAAKLATTSTGVDITGTLTSDGLTVDGVATIQGAATGLVINETDTTDLNSYLNNNVGSLRLMTVNDAFTSFTNRLNIDHATGDISFYEDTGTTAKFFWDASAESLGIGTSSPTSKLHVKGRTIAVDGAAASDSPRLNLDLDGTNKASVLLNRVTEDLQLTVVGSNDMTFTTNSAERMRIDSSGNVIKKVPNTSTNGGIAVNNGTYDAIALGTGGYSVNGGAATDGGIRAYNNLLFGTGSSSTERMRIDSSGDVNIVNELKAGSYNETYAALSGTSPAVNCETGNVFSLSTSGNTTFTFTNPPASGTAYGFTLKVTAGGTHTLTWPGTVDWAGGSAPDAPASGETNVLVFITYDGGTTWYGFQAGAALA